MEYDQDNLNKYYEFNSIMNLAFLSKRISYLKQVCNIHPILKLELEIRTEEYIEGLK